MSSSDFIFGTHDKKQFVIDDFKFIDKVIDPSFIYNGEIKIHNRHDRNNDIQKEAISTYQNNVSSGLYKFEYRECPVCNSREFSIIARQDRYSNITDCVVCCGCGLVQLQPLPSNDSLEAFYKNIYTPMYRGTYKSKVAKITSNSKRAQNFLKFIAKNNIYNNIENEGIIVEAGCGDGCNLYTLKSAYPKFKYIGFDFDASYIETGKDIGLDLRLGYYYNDNQSKDISLLLYCHVFEHILDIRAELQRAYERIKDGGYLLLIVPGMLNILTSNMGDILEKIQNAHLYYFDIDNLIDICAQFGFRFIGGNDSIQALFIKDSTVKNDKPIIKNHIKMPRYMRHDHKIMYFDLVNKIFKINKNKDIAIVIDVLLRNTNPYTGKIAFKRKDLMQILKKRKDYLDEALKLLNLFIDIKCDSDYIFLKY